MKTAQYKGYRGTIEVDTDRNCCRGKLLYIDDLVTYEADSIDQIEQEFHKAVDDYLETRNTLGKGQA